LGFSSQTNKSLINDNSMISNRSTVFGKDSIILLILLMDGNAGLTQSKKFIQNGKSFFQHFVKRRIKNTISEWTSRLNLARYFSRQLGSPNQGVFCHRPKGWHSR
jgi:hypothetical protein